MATTHRPTETINLLSSPEPYHPSEPFRRITRSQSREPIPALAGSSSQARNKQATKSKPRQRVGRIEEETIVITDSEDDDLAPGASRAPQPVVQPQLSPPPPDLEEPKPAEDAQDPSDLLLIRVLEMIPDVQPDHATQLIAAQLATNPEQAFEQVLNHLFDNPGYPKIETKSKGKRKVTEDLEALNRAAKVVKIDYASVDRPRPQGQWYFELALNQLCQDFRYIRRDLARRALVDNNNLYYPAYRYVEGLIQSGDYLPKKQATPASKGKSTRVDVEFEAERAFLLVELQGGPAVTAPDADAPAEEEEDVPEGEGIECGCCFGDFAFDKMVQCPDAHLFCRDCARRNAEEAVGNRKALIVCMDQSGCKLPFSYAEILRFLPEKTFALWERIKAEKEINDAEIDGLAECPFCDFKIIIENEQERLFRCENEDCGVVSCRQCKKEDHLPRTCAEVDADRHLDARHAIEEAMTEALMRKCPKCSKAFVKEQGCNKMTCPNCQALSCYVCRKIIAGYDHFNQAPQGSAQQAKSSKCLLWDDVEKRHHEEVAEAARTAREKQLNDNPDVDQDALKVDLPVAPAPRPAAQPPYQFPYNPLAPDWAAPVPMPPAQGMGANYHHHYHVYQPQLPGMANLYAPPPPPPAAPVDMRLVQQQAVENERRRLQALMARRRRRR